MSLTKHKSLGFFCCLVLVSHSETLLEMKNTLLSGRIWPCRAHSALAPCQQENVVQEEVTTQVRRLGPALLYICRQPQTPGWLWIVPSAFRAVVQCISHYPKFGQSWTVGERFDLVHFEDLLLIQFRNKVLWQVKPQLSPCLQQVWLLIWCTLPSARLWRWRPSKAPKSTRTTRSRESLAPAELFPGSPFLNKAVACCHTWPVLRLSERFWGMA